VRFVHAADVHLGSPLGGLDLRTDAPKDEIRGAPRRAFERLINYCGDHEIDLLLISGDLFDGRADLETQIFVEAQFRRLHEHGVRCVVLRGNHDAASKQVLKLRLPIGISELPVTTAGSINFEDLGVVVHGRGFNEQHVTEQIVATYPEAKLGAFNIGMLHTSASGIGGHEVYAPCTVEQLRAKAYDYWALGHIHKRQVLSQDPPIVFCGNLQGRDPGETGGKGATLVQVENGVIVDAPIHLDFDVVRWHAITIDLSDCNDENSVLNSVEAQIRELLGSADELLQHVVRIDCVGRTSLHRGIADATSTWNDKVQQLVADVGADRIWVERLRFQTSPPLPPVETLRAREDMIGDLARDLGALSAAEVLPEPLHASLHTLAGKVPQALMSGEDRIVVPGLSDGVSASELLGEVERDLLSRLVVGEEIEVGEGL
jgi:exonuclease SbcD